VAKSINRGHIPQQIAVLYRAGSVGLALQPALQELKIPYEVRGAGDLWQGVAAKLVVGALFYLRDGASIEAMSRMGSSRRADIIRGKLDQTGNGRTLSFPAACQLVGKVVAKAVPGKASHRDRAEWTCVVEAITAFATSCRSLQELETKIADQSVALREVPENAVVLSTIHSAKGLEWEAVFVVGMEEGVLPHANNDDLEEERRVAYVAATRAKRVLGLTYADVRFGQNSTPSRFLDELAGKERRHCVWTGSRSDAADERLPLLSDRERQRLSEGLVPEQPSKRSAVTRGRRAKDKSDRGNKSKGAPARHGLAWSAEEDSRLRNMFLSGAAIPAIAQAHQRKRGAITSRLVKLGLVEDRESPRFD
jgi:DNA helicase-2/ATP-dependent DNA helicase PcrA